MGQNTDVQIDLAKLEGYVLNPEHPRGKHKARVFLTALGVTSADAEIVAGWLIDAAHNEVWIPTDADDFGQRYRIDFEAVRNERRASIRSSWIVRTGETFARFVSCHVL